MIEHWSDFNGSTVHLGNFAGVVCIGLIQIGLACIGIIWISDGLN